MKQTKKKTPWDVTVKQRHMEQSPLHPVQILESRPNK